MTFQGDYGIIPEPETEPFGCKLGGFPGPLNKIYPGTKRKEFKTELEGLGSLGIKQGNI